MPHPDSLVLKQSTEPTGSDQKKPILIPKASFTAFRLAYLPATEVNELSTSVFLGRIPDVWVGGPHTNFVFGAVSKARKKFRRRFRQASLTVSQSVRWFLTRPDLQSDEENVLEDEDEGEFNFFQRENKGMEQKFHQAFEMEEKLLQQKEMEKNSGYSGATGELPEQNKNHTGSSTFLRQTSQNLQGFDPDSDEDAFEGEFVLNKRLDTDAASLESWESAVSSSLQSFLPNPEPNKTWDSLKLPTISVGETEAVTAKNCQSTSRSSKYNGQNISNGNLPKISVTHLPKIVTTPSRFSSVSPQMSASSFLSADPKVKFQIGRISTRKSQMSFAAPQPAQTDVSGLLDKQYVRAERDHEKMRERLRVLATKSTGRARNAGSKFKLKVIDTIMASYKAGQVIRVDRMLVLVEKSLLKRVVVHNEGELGETRVVDRWKEYYVVLRKAKLLRLEVQLFEVSSGLTFEGKPEHRIVLNDQLKADFYSASDKTMSLVEKVEDGTMVYIFCAKYSLAAYKWLFIIKELIHDTLVPVINVKVEGLDMQFKIEIPSDMLRASMKPLKVLTLTEQEKGYEIQYGEILEYLKEKLMHSLENIRDKHEKVNLWLLDNPQAWFCFKIYDRVEWAAVANSRTFFIQTQLQSAFSVLEFRQVTRTPMIANTESGETFKRPSPIEGFLARVTNISGLEYSNLRPFYRVQYFYTAEGTLFFSQIFKGTPPSPQNEFMKECDRELVRGKLPEIYYKMSFPLDKNDHVAWLDSPDFQRFDKEAVEEFERKVQQVIKSDAMIDLLSVKQVNALPMDSIIAHHRYFQSFLWYSAPHIIEDEDIMDCAFEIVLLNGSKLKLMAPSRVIRDEWVERLTAHVEFWKSVRTEDVLHQIETRKTNRAKLGISEYVDSNVSSETKELETKVAIGNSRLFNTSAFAMATPVLASGYLFLKYKKHANFNQYYVVLCPGYVVIFTLFQRSKVTGMWKKTPYFRHYLTLLLSQCYIYAGSTTWQDLVESSDFTAPGKNDLPRSYSDGWKSSEEDTQRCFTLWFGMKRKLRHAPSADTEFHKRMGDKSIQNPGLTTMVRKLGITGKKMVFLARSRQEREEWVYKILLEINRFSRA